MKIKMVAALGLAFWLVTAPVHAQQRSEQGMALAREIITLSKGVETSNAMLETMRPLMVAQNRQQGMSERDASRLVDLFFEEMASEYDAIIELSAIAYVDRFSVQQLTEIRDFLASPAGRALSDATPELTAAMTQAGAVIGEQAGLRAAERFRQERTGGQGPS